jgi:hypothetical protein
MTLCPLQIAVSYEEQFPEEIISHFIAEIASPGLDIKSEARESEPQAGLEWLVPTAVIIFIGKAYFDSFLKEMGKDHYHLLKRSVAALWKYIFGNERATNISLVGTKGKMSSAIPYSLLFSIVTDVLGEYRIKYLLKDNISEDDFEKAIETFFSFLEELTSGMLKSEIRDQLEKTRVVGKTILLSYDDGKLKVINPFPEENVKEET